MEKTLIIALLVTSGGLVQAQEQSPTQSLPHFTKIVASPHVNIVLQKGDRESVRFTYNNVSRENVNVRVSGKKLRIYLDHARVLEKQERVYSRHNLGKRGIYQNASITAYVTYRTLKDIEVRGEQELVCENPINTRKLKLRAYGETDIQLMTVNSDKFKVSLYGENKLHVTSGQVGRQVYRLFGENKIDTRGLKSSSATTRLYGEGKINLSASDELLITAFGEQEITVSGSPNISKGIVIGHTDIRRR